MYQLYTNTSLDSQIARYVCAVKSIPVVIKDTEQDLLDLKKKYKDSTITLPVWLEANDFRINLIFPLIIYINDRFPCRDIIPLHGFGDLQFRTIIYQIVYKLLSDHKAWKFFNDYESCKLLDAYNPSLLDAVLIPILYHEKEPLSNHLVEYLNEATMTDEFKFSIGVLGNEFTQRNKF